MTAPEPIPFPPLETPRLRLRCIAPGDAAATSLMMTPEISRWLATWPIPFTPEMAATRIEKSLRRISEGDMLVLAAVEKRSEALIGWLMFSRDKEQKRRGSFGYWLGGQYHGRGYMKELAPAALAAAFRFLDVEVIEAAAQPENAGSLAVMRGCGMTFSKEGMVYAPAREREEFCHFYEITAIKPPGSRP